MLSGSASFALGLFFSMPSVESPCIILAVHSRGISERSDNLLPMSCGCTASFRTIASRASLFIVLNSSSRRPWSANQRGDVFACEDFPKGVLLFVS